MNSISFGADGRSKGTCRYMRELVWEDVYLFALLLAVTFLIDNVAPRLGEQRSSGIRY